MVGFEQELLAVFFVGHSCDLAFLGRRSPGFSKCPGTRGLLLFKFMDLGARARVGVDMVIRKNAETTEPKQSTHARGVCELCGGLGEPILYHTYENFPGKYPNFLF